MSGSQAVRHVERQPLDAQSLQARADLPADPAPRETAVGALLHGVERLRDDHDAVPDVAALRAEPVADERLAAPAAVGVGGVERRDAQLPGGVEKPERFLTARALSEQRRLRADPAEVPAARGRRASRRPRSSPVLAAPRDDRMRPRPHHAAIGIEARPPNTPPWATTIFGRCGARSVTRRHRSPSRSSARTCCSRS